MENNRMSEKEYEDYISILETGKPAPEVDYSKPHDIIMLRLIKDIRSGALESEEEISVYLDFMSKYYPGISNVIFYPKKKMNSDEEVLAEAKKIAQPILL